MGQEKFGDLSCANRIGREVALGALGAYHQPVRAYRILGHTKRAIHRHFVNFDAGFGGFDLFADVAACCRKMQINIDAVYCGPVLRHLAGPSQAANFRSAIAF